MADDLYNTLKMATSIQKNIDEINGIMRMEHTLRSVYNDHLGITRALEMSNALVDMNELFPASKHWQTMIDQTQAHKSIIDNFTTAHLSWSEHMNSIQKSVLESEFSLASKLAILDTPLGHDTYTQIIAELEHQPSLSLMAQLTLFDTSLKLDLSTRIMEGIDFKAIQSRYHIATSAISKFEHSIADFNTSYTNLANSLTNIQEIIQLPSFALPGAARELYTTSLAVDTIDPFYEELDEDDMEIETQLVSIAEQETSDCLQLLRQVDPNLVQPYIGARQALLSNNVDKARQILSSLREMWNHLIRQLAPDNSVIEWLSIMPNKKDLLDKDKPTRKARVLYICRELNNDPLTNFVVQDTQALVALIELFNRIHVLNNSFSDKQLRAILLKTDSWLMYILQIYICND